MKKKEPKGRAKGGIARAKALTPERMSQIGKQGAAARWSGKPMRATHRGTFKEEFGIDVECYVLDDEQKTAVISQRGMGAALGLGQTGGNKLPRFLGGEKIAPYVGPELREKLANPLVFQWSPPAPGAQPPAVVHGYDVTILIDVCKAVIDAETAGALLERQKGCPCWRCAELRGDDDGLAPFRARAADPLTCLHPQDARHPHSGDSWSCGLCGADVEPPEGY